MKRLIASAVALSCFLSGSLFFCGCGPSARKLVQGYRLERFSENGKYYLIASGEPLSGGGVFDGTVERIGWNQDWIMARVTRLYSGDTNGWYAVNVKTKQVIGPIQESELSTNAALSKIECRAAETIAGGR